MFKVQVKAWGNSHAIRIPKEVLDDLNIGVDSSFELTFDKFKKTITLSVDEGITPYQKLMMNSPKTKRKKFLWDRLEEEEDYYS